MAKKLWKVCTRCGAVTDLDEVCCPLCRRNPLIKKFFDENQIKELIKKRKFWTKDLAKIEKWLGI